jgi:hypothetical protein
METACSVCGVDYGGSLARKTEHENGKRHRRLVQTANTEGVSKATGLTEELHGQKRFARMLALNQIPTWTNPGMSTLKVLRRHAYIPASHPLELGLSFFCDDLSKDLVRCEIDHPRGVLASVCTAKLIDDFFKNIGGGERKNHFVYKFDSVWVYTSDTHQKFLFHRDQRNLQRFYLYRAFRAEEHNTKYKAALDDLEMRWAALKKSKYA